MTDDYKDPELEALLAKVGKALQPPRESLRVALGGTSVSTPQASPLFISTSFMTMYSKIGVALVAILVIAGGAYLVAMPRGTNVAMQQAVETLATDEQGSADSLAATGPAPSPATDSFDDFATSMTAELAAQQSAVQSTDSSVDSGVSATNNVTSSGEPYDPSTI